MVKASTDERMSVIPPLLLLGCVGVISALKPCQIRSYHCQTSAEQNQLYPCAERGHFRHPDSVFRYYRCVDAGYAACDCTCRYQDTCFDPRTRTCRFAFLPEVHNCTQSLRTTTPLVPSPATRGTPARKQTSVPDSRTYDLQYRFHNQHKHPDTAGGATPAEKVVRSRARNYNLARQDILTAQEVLLAERGFDPQLVDDVSIFPAWAVAVVVLCVVMLLVLMIIFLY